jgi:hypothetical protein
MSLPRLAVDKKPNFWNKEGAAGLVLGALTLPFAPQLGIPLLCLAAAPVVGAFMGKSRMKREQEQGKVAREPTYANMNVFPGIIKGVLIGAAIAAACYLLAPVAIGSAFSALAIGGKIAFATKLEAIAALVFVSAPTIGAWVAGIKGAISGKKQMEREYAQAESLAQEQQQSRGTSPTTERIAQKQYDFGPDHPALKAEQNGKVWTHQAPFLRISRWPLLPLLGLHFHILSLSFLSDSTETTFYRA